MPAAGVYLVNPAGSALAAASLMCCGVSKSGSPTPKPTTSMPSAFICLALESMARVSEGVRDAARFEILYFIIQRGKHYGGESRVQVQVARFKVQRRRTLS